MATTDTKTNVYEAVTAKIVSVLEAGLAKGCLTWRGQGEPGRIPYNLKTGRPYSGSNVLSLWISADERRFTSPAWLTFKQALDMGGNVRKGEKATLGIYHDSYEKKGETEDGTEESKRVRFAKAFYLFNADQVEGIGQDRPATEWDPLERAEETVASSGANVSEGGTRAFFSPLRDEIRLPDRHRFDRPEDFYAVAFHELTHWTGHKSRLARDFGKRFGTEEYAMEELVAELGAAFLCAETGVDGKAEFHANYVESWLRVLRNDKRAIVTAASAACKAAEFVLRGHGAARCGEPAAPAYRLAA